MRQPVDERADIFAFGVTAYEMFTGKKPVTGDTRKEVHAEVRQFQRASACHCASRVPDMPASIEQRRPQMS